MFFFLKNVSLLILYFSTNYSIITTKREIRNFYRNFHLLPQFNRNKHLKNTATFTATCWKSPREISNFRPQLSQKSPAKSWGDCLVLPCEAGTNFTYNYMYTILLCKYTVYRDVHYITL